MKNKKIVFMGTPNFAVPILQMLIENYNVELVITQPDKKVGRKKILTPTPVKKLALGHNIRVLQPEKISKDEEVYNELLELNPDIIITAAYGQLVPEKILFLPKLKSINVHGSLLPKLRGGAPIQYALWEGHKVTGITIMYMEKRLDAGDMISKIEVPICYDDNYDSLHDKLSIAGRDLLKETLPKIFNEEIISEKQDDTQATFAKNITREDEKIIWAENAEQIFNKVRALDSSPGAFTYLDNKVLKIWKTEIANIKDESYNVGEIVYQDKEAIYVKCGNETTLKILELQLAGKNRITTKNFLSNKKNYIGIKLGDIDV
ncbi:methionyl-tRNA formyltransferase [Gemella sp. GH3]|uniref:methionyl-tRNA formyltransferase n=1 Tax=unclassified Gemella TaxID=2624949 RepID=UPI0015CFCEB6|nr:MULTISPECIES: methionyl-tRNA formyltransferase [unclassified Gemella]MBF0714383.1 methionyl-tRNA formyltransferase [Gemella sp. GH3.1]NYS51335.1 methionyl-tRNA formyltransferase [Gemella sp. GH3]